MSKKKVYRSLFDSDEVFEVEELTDNPEVSTEGIQAVKTEDRGITLDKVYDMLSEVRDLLRKPKADSEPAVNENTGGSTGGNAPAEENKVERVEPVIDKKAKAKDNEAKEEPATTEEASKVESEPEGTANDVKDSYSAFTRVGETKKQDTITATQIAFQNRYAKVANK